MITGSFKQILPKDEGWEFLTKYRCLTREDEIMTVTKKLFTKKEGSVVDVALTKKCDSAIGLASTKEVACTKDVASTKEVGSVRIVTNPKDTVSLKKMASVGEIVSRANEVDSITDLDKARVAARTSTATLAEELSSTKEVASIRELISSQKVGGNLDDVNCNTVTINLIETSPGIYSYEYLPVGLLFNDLIYKRHFLIPLPDFHGPSLSSTIPDLVYRISE